MQFKEVSEHQATLSFMPCHTGDGYDFGGAVIVTVGNRSLNFGEGSEARLLAEEFVKRWNNYQKVETE